jgi:hypothetical protein
MKKISKNQMIKVVGGFKCIYHFMALGTIFGITSYSNLVAVKECWNNNHNES